MREQPGTHLRSVIIAAVTAACVAVCFAGLFGLAEGNLVAVDLNGRAVVAVLILPLAGLDTADDNRQHTLGKPLCNEFRLTAPCDAVDKVGLAFAVRALAVSVDRKAE